MTTPPTIIAAICTYQRNDPLRTLLHALVACAEHLGPRARVGVVVSDDNPGGTAASVVNEFEAAFEAGIHHVVSGKGNISLNRNLAVETAIALGDWVAMTDDDCEPPPHWLSTHLDTALAFDADCVTGQMRLRAPEGAPSWLTDEPFLRMGMIEFADGAEAPLAGTNNSLTRSAWLREHPEIRFLERMGVVGGEDMVFFQTAARAGLRIRFSADAYVHGNEPPERATYKHQLRAHYWMGNTEAVTTLELANASRPRVIVRGIKRLGMSPLHTVRRLASGQSPQLRYTVATAAQSLGLIYGGLGGRIRHH